MLIVEIVLEGQTLEDMEVVAEILGLSLEVAVVMACQHYIRWINENGFPRIVGLHLRAEELAEREATNGETKGLSVCSSLRTPSWPTSSGCWRTAAW